MEQFEFSTASTDGQAPAGAGALGVSVTLDVAGGCFRFEWRRVGAGEAVARGRLFPLPISIFKFRALEFELEIGGQTERDSCNQQPASAHAFLKRLNKRLPVPDERVRVQIVSDADLGPAKAGQPYALSLPPSKPAWKWLAHEIQQFALFPQAIAKLADNQSPERYGQVAASVLACLWLGVPPERRAPPARPAPVPGALRLRVTLEFLRSFIQLEWNDPTRRPQVARGWIRCTGRNELTWELETEGRRETSQSSHDLKAIRAALNGWLERFPFPRENFTAIRVQSQPGKTKPLYVEEPPFGPNDEPPRAWLEATIREMAQQLGKDFAPAGQWEGEEELGPLDLAEMGRLDRKFYRKEEKRAEEEARRRETMARLAEERRRKQRAAEALKAARKAAETKATPPPRPSTLAAPQRSPRHQCRCGWSCRRWSSRKPLSPSTTCAGTSLRERAALWWVSNQSDDLLCLPYCRIEHLDYQVRTALRAFGPLRGRALLSDEVGLGKTIEAGLVLKELLTRGMVKRFLVLTVPSLVDQWEEELSDKFGLTTATTNQAAARDDAEQFWREQPGIVASLHTLKQPAHLEVARQVALGHAHRGRGALPAQPRVAGLAGGQRACRASSCCCSPPRRSRTRSRNFTTSSRCCRPGQLPCAEGIPRPVH